MIPKNAWGKLNQKGDSHPLTGHMLDVAACFWAITQTFAVRRALAQVAGQELTDLDFMRLTVLVFLHDVGKANAGFQAKRMEPYRSNCTTCLASTRRPVPPRMRG
jgi:CRISPR-associated endonuclease/helicase Cas3